MKKIKLIRSNAKIGNYIFEKGLNHFVEFTLPNGIKGVYTLKNFFINTKTEKIQYQTMNCDNASYDELRDYYLEIESGIYYYMTIGSDCQHKDTLETLNRQSDHWPALKDKRHEIVKSAKVIK